MNRSIHDEICDLIPYVYAVAFKLTTDIDRAQDLAQESLLIALEKNEQLNDRSKLKGWLRTVCFNTYLSHQRRESARTLSLDELSELSDEGKQFDIVSHYPSQETEVIVEESVRAIQNGCFLAMARKLTLEQRTAFSLVDMFGISIDEAAVILGVSVPALKGLLHRTRTHLFTFFSGRCEWIDTPDACHCSAWIDFAGRREAVRDQLKNRKTLESFPEKPEYREHQESSRNRILNLYRGIADRRPDDSWYHSVVTLLKEISAG